MQEPHHRDRHHPPRVALALAAATALLACASAHAAGFTPLPSPIAPLSPEPPLAGGAASSAEAVRHRVDSTTTVRVAIDGRGEPFAVTATQRLDVHGTGDYFFTIGAPVVGATPAPGSQSRPGFRTGKVIWAGFDPGERTLAAAIRLDAARAARTLPLRVVRGKGTTTLVDTTSVSASAFTADALRPQLVSYLERLAASLRTGEVPLSGGAEVTSTPVAVRIPVAVPLRVTGTIGGRRVSRLVTGRTVVPAGGSVDLTVTPVQATSFGDVSRLDGRALLALATRASLTAARTRQYLEYLGNPDPTGRNATTFVYRSGTRPARIAAAPPASGPGRSWTTTALIAVGLAVALVAAAYAWSRS